MAGDRGPGSRKSPSRPQGCGAGWTPPSEAFAHGCPLPGVPPNPLHPPLSPSPLLAWTAASISKQQQGNSHAGQFQAAPHVGPEASPVLGGGAFKVGVREGHCASHLVPIGNKEYITPRDPTAFLAPCNPSLFISRLSHRGCFQETLNFLWAGSMQQELTDAERTGIGTLD